jgi:hypothetical protein
MPTVKSEIVLKDWEEGRREEEKEMRGKRRRKGGRNQEYALHNKLKI